MQNEQKKATVYGMGERIIIMTLLWRDPWLKPLNHYDIGAESCKYCERHFTKLEFVTSCEFCEIGIMHDKCANRHVLSDHKKELQSKIHMHRDRALHDYQ
ncbi:MAG: hypothetical protein ACJ70N_02950 [Nitrososphaera sp.]